MTLNSQKTKLLFGAIYLVLIVFMLVFFLSKYNISDFFSYNFIKLNKDVILKYKSNNFVIFTFLFIFFCIVWILLLGFAMPLLIFSGFVFGKWWGTIIVLTATTVGATLLYLLAGLFFKDLIEKKISHKFMKLKKFFNKNELIYFMCFRFVGGGGTPYSIQNVLPVLFNMSVKNYIIATFLGSIPSMFVTVSLGSGIENIIEQNTKLNLINVLLSPEIYFPLIGFFVILIFAFILKKTYLKT